MNTTAQNWDFGDDLGASKSASSAEDIRAAAHIINGGNASFPCPSCKGRGRFISYAGRDVGPCFKCKGTKVVSRGVAAAAKGKVTKAANAAQWVRDHDDVVLYATKRSNKGSTFYAGLLDSLTTYGSWTENQIALIRRDMAKDAEFFAARNAQAATASGTVGVERINALFAKAIESGLKAPVFRAGDLVIKLAKHHADTLYVMDKRIPNTGPYGGPGYAGKIVNGRFEARNVAKPDTLKLLCEIVDDPREAAVKYGRSTGTCGCCGRELTDPESVAAGIGPICAGKWGI